RWYPAQWLPASAGPVRNPRFKRHLHYAAAAARRLARGIFHAMLRHGPRLEREQLLLSRFVNIGAELFAMTAACLRADTAPESDGGGEAARLADYFCKTARLRIEENFRRIAKNADHSGYRLAQETLEGKLAEIERGIVERK
ncbi:MAG: acyl-CoA dehydrogenase family protein, partial [Limisphaerales bacterium]